MPDHRQPRPIPLTPPSLVLSRARSCITNVLPFNQEVRGGWDDPRRWDMNGQDGLSWGERDALKRDKAGKLRG